MFERGRIYMREYRIGDKFTLREWRSLEIWGPKGKISSHERIPDDGEDRWNSRAAPIR